MKFKEFAKWCNERAADGFWSMDVAKVCVSLCEGIYSLPFWKREKVWRQSEKFMVKCVVEPTNLYIEKIVKNVENFKNEEK